MTGGQGGSVGPHPAYSGFIMVSYRFLLHVGGSFRIASGSNYVLVFLDAGVFAMNRLLTPRESF